MQRLIEILREAGTYSVTMAEGQLNPTAALERLFTNYRASTLGARVRAWMTFAKWWIASGGCRFPDNANDFVRYLEIRVAEPCGATVINSATAALRFMEAAAAIPLGSRIGRDVWLIKQAEGLTAELRKGQAPSRQAPRPPISVLVALENLLMDRSVPPTLRCYAWWCAWATLRFSDHRGICTEELGLQCNGNLVLILHRTKTTGKDKKVQERPLMVHKNVYTVAARLAGSRDRTLAGDCSLDKGFLVAHCKCGLSELASEGVDLFRCRDPQRAVGNAPGISVRNKVAGLRDSRKVLEGAFVPHIHTICSSLLPSSH